MPPGLWGGSGSSRSGPGRIGNSSVRRCPLTSRLLPYQVPIVRPDPQRLLETAAGVRGARLGHTEAVSASRVGGSAEVRQPDFLSFQRENTARRGGDLGLHLCCSRVPPSALWALRWAAGRSQLWLEPLPTFQATRVRPPTVIATSSITFCLTAFTVRFATVEVCSEICPRGNRTPNPSVQALEGSIPVDKRGGRSNQVRAYMSLAWDPLALLHQTCAPLALVAVKYRTELPTVSSHSLWLLLFPLHPDLACFLKKIKSRIFKIYHVVF